MLLARDWNPALRTPPLDTNLPQDDAQTGMKMIRLPKHRTALTEQSTSAALHLKCKECPEETL